MIPSGLCQCGCGGKTKIVQETCRPRGEIRGEPRRFLAGHRRPPLGPRICAIPGCGKVTSQRNTYCPSHYFRLRKYNSLELPVKVDYEVDGETGCWNWLGHRNENGYGVRTGPGPRRQCYAHRWMYEQAHGPIPRHLCLDHLCRNRACVNPKHLEVVTYAENTRRGTITKLTREQVAEIRSSAGKSQRQLAREFGVNAGHICRIRRGMVWRDAPVGAA